MPPPQRLELGHQLAISVAYPSTPGSLQVRLTFRGRSLVDTFLSAERPRARIALALGPCKAEMAVVLDVFAGEVRLVTDVAVRRTTRCDSGVRWKHLVNSRRVMLRFAPAAGQVAGSAAVHAPTVDDPTWGSSQLCTPAVLRLFVDDSHRSVTAAGRIVKQVLFPEHPPFVFNTVACVGSVAPGAPGVYSDPLSHWFNVFFGYYQIDCDKSLWSRPFAYRSPAGSASAVEADDIIRLGTADWNWFSNWVYGTPTEVAMSYSSVRSGDVTIGKTRSVDIGGRRWHQLRISGVQMASCYEAGTDSAGRLVRNAIATPIWRRAFGLPRPRAGFDQSFVPTSLETDCELCYWEDSSAFHTVVFGATAAVGTDPAFMEVQQSALQQVITRAYPTLGF
ncbi:MAG: hypothetical protein ACYC1D_05905 [Acidimicrobiales bacterium]